MKKRQHFPVRGGTERYDLVRRKIDRAKTHIDTLGSTVRQFLESRPYVIATKRDPQTRRLTYYAASIEEPPEELCEIAGDAFHNLRSALDHLAWQLVVAAGSTPTSDTAFPIYDDAAKYRDHAPWRMRGMAEPAVRAIDALEPWKGGKNDALWRLHRLDIVDKHRDWLVIGSRYNSVNITPVLSRGMAQATTDPAIAANMTELIEKMPLWLKPAASLEPLKAGDGLFTDAPDAPENPKIQFAFDIAIHQPGVAEGEPLMPMLQRLADLVGHVAYTLAPHLR